MHVQREAATYLVVDPLLWLCSSSKLLHDLINVVFPPGLVSLLEILRLPLGVENYLERVIGDTVFPLLEDSATPTFPKEYCSGMPQTG